MNVFSQIDSPEAATTKFAYQTILANLSTDISFLLTQNNGTSYIN
jgi:hypothetical protein